jgi:flagellar biosynthesis chaperone FliJ
VNQQNVDEQLQTLETAQQDVKQSIERGRELVEEARRQLTDLSEGTTEH